MALRSKTQLLVYRRPTFSCALPNRAKSAAAASSESDDNKGEEEEEEDRSLSSAAADDDDDDDDGAGAGAPKDIAGRIACDHPVGAMSTCCHGPKKKKEQK